VGEYADSLAIALLDRGRGFARIVLGGTDAAPLLLPTSARAALEGAPDERLRAQLREELAAAGRNFTPAQLILHTTTVLRAVKDAATPR
jgi:carbon-monoxide dehydrogenase medium subunit